MNKNVLNCVTERLGIIRAWKFSYPTLIIKYKVVFVKCQISNRINYSKHYYLFHIIQKKLIKLWREKYEHCSVFSIHIRFKSLGWIIYIIVYKLMTLKEFKINNKIQLFFVPCVFLVLNSKKRNWSIEWKKWKSLQKKDSSSWNSINDIEKCIWWRY